MIDLLANVIRITLSLYSKQCNNNYQIHIQPYDLAYHATPAPPKYEKAGENISPAFDLIVEAPCSKLQGIFDPQGSTVYSNRSLSPQQAMWNALAPGFKRCATDAITPLRILGQT
jgi:hypothetical protein